MAYLMSVDDIYLICMVTNKDTIERMLAEIIQLGVASWQKALEVTGEL